MMCLQGLCCFFPTTPRTGTGKTLGGGPPRTLSERFPGPPAPKPPKPIIILPKPPVIQTEKTFPSPPPGRDSVKSPVETVSGICHQKIDRDNSCLFRAILTAVGDSRTTDELRRFVIPDYISYVPQAYFYAEEGRPSSDEYKARISDPRAWGGSIELHILSHFYGVQICVVPVHNGDMVPYPEVPFQDDLRIYVIYNGTHYDCLMPKEVPEGKAGVFRANDRDTEQRVIEMRVTLADVM